MQLTTAFLFFKNENKNDPKPFNKPSESVSPEI